MTGVKDVLKLHAILHFSPLDVTPFDTWVCVAASLCCFCSGGSFQSCVLMNCMARCWMCKTQQRIAAEQSHLYFLCINITGVCAQECVSQIDRWMISVSGAPWDRLHNQGDKGAEEETKRGRKGVCEGKRDERSRGVRNSKIPRGVKGLCALVSVYFPAFF